MAEVPVVPAGTDKTDVASSPRGAERSKDEIALELMKFIAVTTGYGKGYASAAGFSGKPTKSPEEYADALIQLFERCRGILGK